MTVILSTAAPFASGGNRLCFVDPANRQKCIKVRRPDFSLEDRRRKKGFPKNLRPLSAFDDNAEEHRVMVALDQRFGEPLYQLVSRCFGFVDTDMGKGLVSELIRDGNGPISHTLKQYIWDHGFDDNARAAVERFCSNWVAQGIPSRDLLLHNLVVQRDADGLILRLVLIDGLGGTGLIPDAWLPLAMLRQRARRKTINLHERIEQLLPQRGQAQFPGYHGRLLHDGVNPAGKQDTDAQEKPSA